MSEQADGGAGGRRAISVILPVIAVLLGLGGGFAGAWFLGFGGGGTEAADEDAAPAVEEGAAEEAAAAPEGGEAAAGGAHGAAAPAAGGKAVAEGPSVVNLGTFTVNLRGSGGGRVLRLEVQVEAAGKVADALNARMAQVRDAVITAASDYTWSEIEGTDGKTRLRDELLARVNGAVAPNTVMHIYFTQFVVQ